MPDGQDSYQATLVEHTGGCPVCLSTPNNVAEHLLTEHSDTVNKRIDDLLQRNGHTEPDDDSSAVESTDATPAMFGEVQDTTHGHAFGTFNDPRECNDCGKRLSQSYARTFARESGDLWCPECKSRSQRYSNDTVYGEDSGSNPAHVSGSANGMSSANDTGVVVNND